MASFLSPLAKHTAIPNVSWYANHSQPFRRSNGLQNIGILDDNIRTDADAIESA